MDTNADRYEGLPSGLGAADGRGAGHRPPLACYANYFEIGYNAFEFLLDTGQVEPQSGEIRFTSRVAISPVHAKLLSGLLARSIAQFEAVYETIPDIAQADPALTGLTCPDDFERRALDVRRRAMEPSSAARQPVAHER